MARKGKGKGKGPGRLRRWLVRPFVWALAILALLVAGGLLYLKSDAASERARALLTARLSDALERPVTLGEVRFGLAPLSVEVRDLVIPGPEPGDRPVVVLPRGRLELSLAALRQRRVRLERLWLEGPQVYLQFNPDGTDNLPRPRSRPGGAQQLEVEIGTLLVEEGSVEIDQREVPLALEAREVVASLGGVGEGLVLDGRAEAREVLTTLPGALPYPVWVRAQVVVAPGAVELTEGRLQGPHLSAEATGTYTWEEGRQSLHVAVEADGDGEVLTRLGYTEGQVQGPLRFDGTFDWDGSAWRLAGTGRSPRLLLEGRVLTEVEAEVAGHREAVRADILGARYAGGTLTGVVQVGLGPDPEPVSVDLDTRGLDAARLAADQGIPVRGVAGTVSGAVTYRFTTDDPRAGYGWAELEVVASAVEGRRIPLRGEVVLGIAGGVLASEVIRLRSPRQRVLVENLHVDLGSGEGGLDFHLTSEDVGRLGVLLPPPAPGEPPPAWLPTSGHGVVAGSVRFGGPLGVVADVQLDLEEVVAPAVMAEALSGSLTLTAAAAESLRLELSRNGGALLVSGRVPFGGGAQAPAQGMELTVDAASWPLEEARALLPFELPVEGPVSGLVELTGAGEELYGRLSATVQPVSVAGVSADEAAVQLSFAPEALQVEQARLSWPAGDLRASGALGLGEGEGELSLRLEAPGLLLDAEPFTGLWGGQLQGAVDLAATVTGTLERPQAELRLAARGLASSDRELGEAEAVARWDGGRLEASGSLLGLIAFNGGGALDTTSADLGFEVAGDDLGALLQVAARGSLPPVGGTFGGELTVRGDLEAPQVALALHRLRVSYQQLALANREPVAAHLEGAELVVDSFYLGNPDGDDELFAAGTVGLSGDIPLDLNLQGSIAARWAELLLPQVRLTGSISTLGHIGGTGGEPDFDGLAGLAGGELILRGFPHALEDLEAVVLLYPEQMVLDTFEGRLAGGRIRAAGSLDLADPGSYRLQAAADGVRLRYPEGWVLEGDAELSLLPAEGGRQLRGSVDLERAYYLQEISLNLFQLLAGFLRRQRLEVGWTDPLLASTQLNVVIDGAEAVRVRNNVANLRGDADLVIRGNLARPIPVGQVEVERGGTVVYGDTEYEVDRGLLTFASLDRIDPLLDLIARTRVSNYQVTLNLSGTLDRLNATFASEPPLPDLDVLALLTTGQTLGRGGELGGLAASRNSSAEVFLYGQAASVIGERVSSLFGFDKFRIDPTATAGDSVSSARVTIGKQISRDLYVTYSRSATSNEDELVQAEWRVEPNVVLVFTVTDGEDYAVEVRWERRF